MFCGSAFLDLRMAVFKRPVLMLLNRQPPNSPVSSTAGPNAKLLPHNIYIIPPSS